ncbi:hypothetical protein NDU88_011016 [Pleurodeles waltl]|uniref:Uncharacterized protein n=1 Tax=Pleurodeles waltl TaxID=8319 RepID=A0AAV7PWY6_PLEWA|nr:hypothetical protein NDU88_011016 [Pleurodeles waltl]
MPESQGQSSWPEQHQQETRPGAGSTHSRLPTMSSSAWSKCGSRTAPGAFFTRQAQVHGAEQQHSSARPTRPPTAASVQPVGPSTHCPGPVSSPPDRDLCGPAASHSVSGSPTRGAEKGRTASASCGSTKIRAAPAVQQQGGHQA